MSENKQYAPVSASANNGQGQLSFIRASKLAEEGITGVVAEGIYEGTVANSLEPT